MHRHRAQHHTSLNEDTLQITTAFKAGLKDKDVADFYALNWQRPIALGRADFTRWQFCEAPDASGNNHSVVALQNNKIVAVMGANPRTFILPTGETRGAELTTWIVNETARGRGVGTRILTYLKNHYDVLMGAGITSAAQPLYLGGGFTFLAHIPRFFHVTDFDKVKLFTDAIPSALSLVKKRQSYCPEVAHEAVRCNAFDLGDLGKHAHPMNCMGMNARKDRHLSWRYDNHPVFAHDAYRVHSVSTPGKGAGVILRQDHVLDTPILHLLDLFGDPHDFAAAFNFVEAEAHRRGAAFVDASFTYAPLVGQARARYWNSAVDDPLIDLPSLFYPVELRRPPTTSVAFWSRNARDDLYAFSQLHITKGDMDLDRPTLAYYESKDL
ncbi:GNAT family N-acetyltransferase [Shimia sp.]|uniref:GNAT family N-acetyltransferase n=1 Tax=Shimia sp. TaxID=1954381 RepID=UPI003299C67F